MRLLSVAVGCGEGGSKETKDDERERKRPQINDTEAESGREEGLMRVEDETSGR